MTNTETLSTTALDVQAIRKKLEKHFSDLPAEANKIKNTAVWLNDIADDIELEE